VLFVEWVPSTGGLPVPAEPHIGFTFDQLRDFVVFARLCRLSGPDLLKLAAGIQGAGPSSPLVGGLRFLVLERLGQLSESAPSQEIVDLLLRLDDIPRQALLCELFLGSTSGRLAQVLGKHLRVLFVSLDPAEQKGFLEAARSAFEHLECKGLIAEAGNLCSLVRDLGLSSHPEGVLPLLCAWSRLQLRTAGVQAAMETAQFVHQAAQLLSDRSFHAEAMACWSDALHASGRRREAADAVLAILQKGIADLSETARFAVCQSSCRVLHERGREMAAEARARLRQMANESGRPRWLAQACFAELGNLLKAGKLGMEPATGLVEECLTHARQAGCPAVEAEAFRFAGWCWEREPSKELTFIEAGMEAADAANDVASRAEFLFRQAHWLIHVGRFREAEEPASESALLFERLGYRERTLRLRQHVLVISEWEQGCFGKALDILRGNLEGFREMGMFAEAALSALLIAELICDLGEADVGRASLNEARKLAEEIGKVPRLNYDLVEGRILEIEQNGDAALAAYGRARDFGRSARFPDFVYQPGIHAVRYLTQRADPAKNDLDRADALLQELLEDQTVDRKHRERYEGEMYVLFARLHAERGNLEQAEVWLAKTDEWFTGNPTHRGVPEWKATRLVLDWLTAARLEQAAAESMVEGARKEKGRGEGAGTRRRAQGIKVGVCKRVQTDVLDLVQARANTYSIPREAKAYYAHHPVHALLRRHGIEPG
jgi:hypothetical protein